MSACADSQVFAQNEQNQRAYECLTECPTDRPYFDEYKGCVSACEEDAVGVRAFINRP